MQMEWSSILTSVSFMCSCMQIGLILASASCMCHYVQGQYSLLKGLPLKCVIVMSCVYIYSTCVKKFSGL